MRPKPRLHLPCDLTTSSALARITSTTITFTTRTLSTTAQRPHPKKPSSTQLPPRPTLPDSDLRHVYLKGSGPGGQKINKTSSAVQLTHIPTGIVVKSQATRSQSQNHTIARRILAEKIELLEKGGESRAAKVVERKRRRKASMAKKARRKYRRLEEGGRGLGEVGAVAGGMGGGSGGEAECLSGDLDRGEDEADGEWVDADEVDELHEEFEDSEGVVAEAGHERKTQDDGHNGTIKTGAEG